MRRSVLLTLTVVGGVLGLVASTGVFAALSDTADSGTNSASSSALPASADLQLATATGGGTGAAPTCGTYSENLTTPWFTMTDFDHGDGSLWQALCVKNVGSQTVSLTMGAVEVSDVDTGCTGDESSFDQTCGADAAGELSPAIYVGLIERDCATASQIGQMTLGFLPAWATTPKALASMDPGAVRCFEVGIQNFSEDSDVRQAQQSDTVSWKFRFAGQS